jgi:hypothetical protein
MGYTDLIYVAGSDRLEDFTELLNKYNGKDYTFNSINVVSAGERDPDADGAEGMSASKMRAAAAEDNFEAFAQGLPKGLHDNAKNVFSAVRTGMGIKELDPSKGVAEGSDKQALKQKLDKINAQMALAHPSRQNPNSPTTDRYFDLKKQKDAIIAQLKQGVAEGANDMTPNWAKYVLDQIYNSDGAVTLTDLFDEGIPGLHDMFMATAEAHGLDPEEEFEDVQHELTVELEDLIKGGHEEGVAEGTPGNDFRVGQRVIYKTTQGQQFPSIVTAVDFDEDAVKIKSADNKPFPNSGGDIEIVVDPGWKFLTVEPRVDPNSVIAVSPSMRKTTERVRDPEDWDEGNTEPPNNFAVYINGKKWKVFQGRGQYAEDQREKAHYQQLKDWAANKSATTGKKWEVYITGEAPTA